MLCVARFVAARIATVLIIGYLVLAACGPTVCEQKGGHVVKTNCHDEYVIDLQPQADGSILNLSRFDTVCDRVCVVPTPERAP